MFCVRDIYPEGCSCINTRVGRGSEFFFGLSILACMKMMHLSKRSQEYPNPPQCSFLAVV